MKQDGYKVVSEALSNKGKDIIKGAAIGGVIQGTAGFALYKRNLKSLRNTIDKTPVGPKKDKLKDKYKKFKKMGRLKYTGLNTALGAAVGAAAGSGAGTIK